MGLKYHLVLAALVACTAGCSAPGKPAAPAAPNASGAPSGLPATCLDATIISAAAGFAVHVEPATVKQNADAVTCTFLADDQTARPGVNITILVAPASYASAVTTDGAGRAQASKVVADKLVAVTVDGMGLSDPPGAQRLADAILTMVAAKAGPPASSHAAAAAVPKKAAPVTPPPRESAGPAGSTEPPRGSVAFDPFDAIGCTWVPRLFVYLSGHARPGIDVRVPLLASEVDTPVVVTIRSELNGSPARATTTVTVHGAQWHGVAHLALAAPALEDFVSIMTQLDTEGKLAGTAVHGSWRTVEGMLPDPRPASDQTFACNTTG